MVPNKVMIDEIGRELRSGLDVAGEWIILYALLAIQLIYNDIVVLQLLNVRRKLF